MSQAQQIEQYVARRLRWLRDLPEHPRKAALAHLRRGVGRIPGDLPELWGMFLDGMPEELKSQNGKPTSAEWAIYLALTLYALHQQGHVLPGDDMNQQGVELGQAARRLVSPGEDPADSSIQKRLNALATAPQMREIAQHLRGMIQLLRAAGIPLGYTQLAKDLFYLQFQDSASRVRLRWGQDFYAIPAKDDQTEEERNHG